MWCCFAPLFSFSLEVGSHSCYFLWCLPFLLVWRVSSIIYWLARVSTYFSAYLCICVAFYAFPGSFAGNQQICTETSFDFQKSDRTRQNETTGDVNQSENKYLQMPARHKTAANVRGEECQASDGEIDSAHSSSSSSPSSSSSLSSFNHVTRGSTSLRTLGRALAPGLSNQEMTFSSSTRSRS